MRDFNCEIFGTNIDDEVKIEKRQSQVQFKYDIPMILQTDYFEIKGCKEAEGEKKLIEAV